MTCFVDALIRPPLAAWISAPPAILSRIFFALLLCVVALAGGCGESGGQAGYRPQFGDRPATVPTRTEYLFGVHPLHNPSRLFELYGPIVDVLNASIPEAHFSLEASRNYEEFDKKLYARHFDLALPNPYQTIKALKHGYQVFGKMGDDEMFRGIILVRRDGSIRNVADLKDKAVSFPAMSALAATMMPQQYLSEHGMPLGNYEPRYVGSQESSIMNAYLGNTVASATWPPPWIAFKKDHPDYAAQLKILWTTDALPNNSLMARDDFPPQLLQRVGTILFSLQDSKEGQEILAHLPLSGFEAANEETYRPVREFITHFSRTVRSLEE